uniref:Triple functional domain protein-like n=1 Tax=Diabrotica virgifera virgifera TaxID=50390 RepID=A0A6P7GCH9_DIAVI
YLQVSSLTLKSLEGATSADLAEIEQIVKERMEQHSENQERHSLMRDAKSENAISEYGGDLSAQGFSNEATGLAFSGDESDKPSEDNMDTAKKTEILLRKREYVLQELIDTEEAYVRDLSLIVDGYIATIKDPECEIPMPEDLKDGKDKLVFGNIEVIYDWHKNFFLKSLKQAVENPIELASLFKRYERKLQMYVIYCKNKHVSEYIVSEYLETYFEDLRVKLGHKLQLCDLLIKPVQRIMKYQLMLKDILKYTERAGITAEIEPLRAAYNIMVIVPKTANDMMDVGRLQGFEGKITAQGTLLLHGMLTVSDLPGSNPIIGKNKDLHVFFFEQSIIFSEVVGKKTQFTSPQYIYKAHIQVNKMSLNTKEDCFILESTDPSRCLGFVLQAGTVDLQEQWLITIHDTLQKQRDFLKAIQSPIAYQKELTTKEASLSDLSMWEVAPLRRALPHGSPSEPSKSHKKNHYVHKANTIGIPSEDDLNDSKNNNPRSRLNFFEGFKNSLRNKHKSDTVVLETAKENSEKGDMHRRWSEANHTADHLIMPPGTQARLVCEWPHLNLGDLVTIIRYDPTQGYFVRTSSSLEEFWIPAHVLANYSRKLWSFRLKKPRKSLEGILSENSDRCVPEFRDRLKDITVQSGSKVVFKCRVKNWNRNTRQTWKKMEPNVVVLHNGKFVQGDNEGGIALMVIENARASDAGTYCLTVSNEFGSITCTAKLSITSSYPPIPEPKIQVISCSSVSLEWESNHYSQFIVEYCKLGSGEWISPNNNHPVNSHSFTVENLIPGETYSFRIVSAQNNVVSLPSVAVTLPVAENLRWQQEQFKQRYIELEEIDRGRFSIVRLARDRGTGEEVALKQISRRKQSHQVTQAEYSLLAGMQHPNIIRSLALFDNAPLPGIDTIILELVKGPLLFKYISDKETYSESDVRNYTCQLISALKWLHQKSIAHLDVKPENVMIDITVPIPLLKLVDFGDSVNTSKNVILPPACLEFASPELVLGQPVGVHTDCWAVGVFLYVMLSGVSPFLDDSVEETTANILKCDFCFPDEYFGDVSQEAKDLTKSLLVLVPAQRLNMEKSLQCVWIKEASGSASIPSARLKMFMQRRHPMNLAPSNSNYYKEDAL